MTTLAFKDGVLATDSRCTMEGSIINDRCEKIVVRGGRCFSVVGALAQAMRFLDALTDGENRKKLPSMEAACCVAELLPTGNLKIYEDGGTFELHSESFTAYGSGTAAAMAAFHMGAGAVEAVEIACKVDVYSGGPISAARWQDGKLILWGKEGGKTCEPRQPLLLEGPKA
jgi:hypothetical protein